MEDIRLVLEAVAAIIWPILAFIVLILFFKPIKEVIDSAVKRKFTIKVGDNEISMEEASEQQRRLLYDLQEQVVAMQRGMEEKNIKLNALEETAPIVSNVKSIKRILWVDDNPSNNASIIANLTDLDIIIDAALSTKEGLMKFGLNEYDVIISDMTRYEDGMNVPMAGITLTKAIREQDENIPIYIFCTRRGKKRSEKEAISEGVTGITASGVKLFSWLTLTGLERSQS